jgi:ATP-binding cassette subfamily B protein
MTAKPERRRTAIRVAIPFVFRHWLNQPARAATVAGGLLGATVADLFMPLFSGRLVDALTLGASDPAARHAAVSAFGAIVALGLVSMILRLIGLQAIVPFTLRIMSDVSRDAFMRCNGSRPTGTPTALPARPCARSPVACGRSTSLTTPF